MRSIEVLFSPAEFEALHRREIGNLTAVVFDVLRATTTIVTALMNGAESVMPVRTIEEAVAVKRERSDVLLAGERDGLRITSALTGGIDFDLGNSPREFTPDRVTGKTVVMTTTNGTRALKACAGARHVLAGSFLNLPRIAEWVERNETEGLLIVCSGTHEEASFEDTLGAGALCDALWSSFRDAHVADSARIARLVYQQFKDQLPAAAAHARNGRRLLAIPELREDVPLCLTPGGAPVLARMDSEGFVRRWDGRDYAA